MLHLCNASFFRVWRGQVWPSLSSQKQSSKCPSLLCGPSCSSSCSSASDSPLCLATSREWWFPYRTSGCYPNLGPKKFSAVNSGNCWDSHSQKLWSRGQKYCKHVCFVPRSHLFGVFLTGAHIRHALRKLLARPFWQLCWIYSSSGYRLHRNVFCHLHLRCRQVSTRDRHWERFGILSHGNDDSKWKLRTWLGAFTSPRNIKLSN